MHIIPMSKTYRNLPKVNTKTAATKYRKLSTNIAHLIGQDVNGQEFLFFFVFLFQEQSLKIKPQKYFAQFLILIIK